MNSASSFRLAGSLLLLALHSLPGHAEPVRLYDRPVSAAELGRVLFAPEAGPKLRSISFAPKAKGPIEIAQNVAAERASVGLPIRFAYNSATLLPDAKPFLDEVGKLLTQADYADKGLIIEGHTDAAGAEPYNLALSKRRARAVKTYLTQHYGVPGNRLQTRGFGEQKPLPGHDPYDRANRRVQFYSAH